VIEQATHERRVLDFAVEAERLGLAVEIGETRKTRGGLTTEIASADDVELSVIGSTLFVVSRRAMQAAARTRRVENTEATIERKRREARKGI
jgi:hypothetical protein